MFLRYHDNRREPSVESSVLQHQHPAIQWRLTDLRSLPARIAAPRRHRYGVAMSLALSYAMPVAFSSSCMAVQDLFPSRPTSSRAETV